MLAVLAFLAGASMTPGPDMRDVALRPPMGGAAAPATVTMNATPFERTVVCQEIEIEGTTTGGATSAIWTASPSGESGACTIFPPDPSVACNIIITPDAVGEGVETITVTATGPGGDGTDTFTLGFYVADMHSCFLSQNIDGIYNTTGIADLDAVATWTNMGTSSLDVTQGVAGSQPSYRTAVVGGQPVVRCDGGDRVAASTATDWNFLHTGNDNSMEAVFKHGSAAEETVVANVVYSGGQRGSSLSSLTGTGTRFRRFSAALWFAEAAATTSATAFYLQSLVHTFSTTTFVGYVNNSTAVTVGSLTYSALDAQQALNICSNPTPAGQLTGDVFRVLIYQSALSSTQRGINKAVDEWALGGGALPVAPVAYRYDSSASSTITTAGGSVSSWLSSSGNTLTMAQGTAGSRPTSTVSGTSSEVSFDGTDDFVNVSLTSVANSHIFIVATIDSIATNGTGASCYINDGVGGWFTYGGIKVRTDAGVAYAIAHNFDGSHDCAETTFTLGQKVILEQRVDGTNVSIAIDGGAFTSTASGSTSIAGTTLGLGARDASNDYMDGKIHDALFYTDDLSTTQRAAVIAELEAKWGL